MTIELQILNWNKIPYEQALTQMNALRDQRLQNEIPDTLIFLEHPAVITEGRRDSHEDLKKSVSDLSKAGVDFVKTDRGGKLTYHGPGQLVVYFVIDLAARKLSIEDLVRLSEEGVLQCLNSYQIKATRDPENPGLWAGDRKIASVGFHVHRNITTHGVSFNVNVDLTPYSYFIPCGISNRGITTLQNEVKKEVNFAEVQKKLEECYKSLLTKPNAAS